MLARLVPIVTQVRPVQSVNASFQMFVTWSGIVMLVRLVQALNVDRAMSVTLSGIVTLVRRVQPSKAEMPMLATLLAIVTLIRLVQTENAEPPMLVTLLGIVTPVTLLKENAVLPILTTGMLLVTAGMTTAPPGPVYFVIVSAPLLVVKVNWACTADGTDKSSNAKVMIRYNLCCGQDREALFGFSDLRADGSVPALIVSSNSLIACLCIAAFRAEVKQKEWSTSLSRLGIRGSHFWIPAPVSFTITPVDVQMETDRLLLRPLALNDAPALSRLAGRREIADTTTSIPHPYSEAQAREWIEKHTSQASPAKEAVFAITIKPGGELIGTMGLREIDQQHSQAEMGFWIAVEWWGKDVATEAAQAVIRFGFEELKLNRIYAHHMVRNPASGRVLEKVGMQREGLQRQRVRKWGFFEDVVLMAILQSDWQTLRAQRP